MLLKFVILSCCVVCVMPYSLLSYAISNESKSFAGQCALMNKDRYRIRLSHTHSRLIAGLKEKHKGALQQLSMSGTQRLKGKKYDRTTTTTTRADKDPLVDLEVSIHKFLYGPKVDAEPESILNQKNYIQLLGGEKRDLLKQYPSGNVLRAETFHNKAGVHLPLPEFMHRGHCRLNITKDVMQTAVNAFAILVDGDLIDVLKLPPFYVLSSARTIAMMKIAREKMAAMWTVVKAGRKPAEIPHWTLEAFRPLFKYLNGREMARLNLSDNRILTYIGTHNSVDRHQMGVVASRYMKLNPNWSQPKYLNLMNNVLCGIPMSFMRKIESNTYLQLTHQVFYHTTACDPMQRRFYLAMMTRTEALGKSYSWSASDVSRLGLLLAEVEGPDLAAINPEAMSGITAQVMLEMPAQSLQYITESQLKYFGLKPLNILARKLKAYQDQLRVLNMGHVTYFSPFLCYILMSFLSLLVY